MSMATAAKTDADKRTHFKVIRYMNEAGVKLNMKAVPLATAAIVYHKFFQECRLEDYDPYLIATTALYLAGKIEEEHVRIRDVINVAIRTLHPTEPALDIGSTYFTIRDSVVQCELFIMRALKFQVSFTHPHKYLLHYIKSMNDWSEPHNNQRVPIARTAWALLRDSYHGNLCLRNKPDQIAAAILYFAMQCHGVEVPYSEEAEYMWWEALVEDLTVVKIRKIIVQIMDIYDLETTVS